MALPSLAWQPVQFGQQAPSTAIQNKLNTYEAGWKSLLQWDQKTHRVPVFENVKLPQLLKAAQAFLQRQTTAKPHQSVPFLVGMAGGTASGKSTIKDQWLNILPEAARNEAGWKPGLHGPAVDEIELDHYYNDFSAQRKAMGDDHFFKETNLDDPGVVSLNAARKDLLRLKNGKAARVRRYDFADSSSKKGQQLKIPAPFVFAEGLFALVPQPLRNLFDMKVFVSADYETRKQRWWARAASRNIHDNEAGHAMFNRGMTMHDQHVEPTKAHADVVLNGAAALPDLQETMHRLSRLLVKTFYPNA